MRSTATPPLEVLALGGGKGVAGGWGKDESILFPIMQLYPYGVLERGNQETA